MCLQCHPPPAPPSPGALLITIGLFLPWSCYLFALPHWWLFLLDKQAWTNHAYLYGLVGLLLAVTDSGRTW